MINFVYFQLYVRWMKLVALSHFNPYKIVRTQTLYGVQQRTASYNHGKHCFPPNKQARHIHKQFLVFIPYSSLPTLCIIHVYLYFENASGDPQVNAQRSQCMFASHTTAILEVYFVLIQNLPAEFKYVRFRADAIQG